MTMLLTQSGVIEERRAAESPDPRAVASPLGAAVPALWRQVGESLRLAGLSKLDISILIGIYTFVILLAIALCLAARMAHPDAWAWGLHFINLALASAGAGLLVLASLAAAAALHFARRANQRFTAGALGATALCCVGFVVALVIDLDNQWAYGIRPGDQFRPNERYVARRFGVKLPRQRPGDSSRAAAVAVLPAARRVDADNGRRLFVGTCMTCHGARGEGLPGQGKSLIGNEFVGGLDDAKLVGFLKVGRQPWDPLNTTKVQMPPRGGNPMLTDDDLRDIGAYLRTLQAQPADASAALAPAAASQPGGTEASRSDASAAAAPSGDADPALIVAGWVVPAPPVGPQGLSPDFRAEFGRPRWMPPRDGVAFANGYFLISQFGAVHAGAIAIVFGVLCVQALRRRALIERPAPLALGLVACGVMTVTWLMVFPAVYLM